MTGVRSFHWCLDFPKYAKTGPIIRNESNEGLVNTCIIMFTYMRIYLSMIEVLKFPVIIFNSGVSPPYIGNVRFRSESGGRYQLVPTK